VSLHLRGDLPRQRMWCWPKLKHLWRDFRAITAASVKRVARSQVWVECACWAVLCSIFGRHLGVRAPVSCWVCCCCLGWGEQNGLFWRFLEKKYLSGPDSDSASLVLVYFLFHEMCPLSSLCSELCRARVHFARTRYYWTLHVDVFYTWCPSLCSAMRTRKRASQSLCRLDRYLPPVPSQHCVVMWVD